MKVTKGMQLVQDSDDDCSDWEFSEDDLDDGNEGALDRSEVAGPLDREQLREQEDINLTLRFLLDMATTNAYIIYKDSPNSDKKLTQMDFL